ncbi:MAG: hypothetical protein IPH07_19700 [Deltaproteobacteria bacterium]|nr:hypothetical protein [Deltaproteobacteria bacterium]MBK8715930.1 hypothetical protein [Deltaproteobacteria bacterium]MBP7286662.1 hypothetical protein [Nannocystaceae bacterium]
MVDAQQPATTGPADPEQRLGLRVAAGLTLVVALARVVVWIRVAGLEAQAEGAELGSEAWQHTLDGVITLQTLLHHVDGVYVLAIAALASAWSRGRPAVRVAQWIAVISTLAQTGAMALLSQGGDEPFEVREARFELAQHVMAWAGLGSTLALVGIAAGAASARWARTVLTVVVAPWVVLAVLGRAGVDVSAVSPSQWGALATALMASLAIAWWSAASREAHGRTPVHARAIQGLWLLQTALLLRIGASVIASTGLAVAMSARRGVGALLVAHVITHALLAATALVGLRRYASLPAAGHRRDVVGWLAACVVLGVVLEVAAALALWRWLTAIEGPGEGPFGIVSTASLVPLQQAATWIGRAAAVTGLVTVLSLVATLRHTARWLAQHLEDERGQLIAFVTVLLAVAIAMVMGALTLLREASPPPTLIVIVGVGVIATSLWLLSAWLRLFGALRGALQAGRGAADSRAVTARF